MKRNGKERGKKKNGNANMNLKYCKVLSGEIEDIQINGFLFGKMFSNGTKICVFFAVRTLNMLDMFITRFLLKKAAIILLKISNCSALNVIKKYIHGYEIEVRMGYFLLMTIPPDVKYQERFLKAFQEARENKRGLWRV